jgi:transcriptional regulator with XRE-family HTH domain
MTRAGARIQAAHVPALLLEERRKRGWTQEDIHQITGLYASQLSQWERGIKVPDLLSLVRWAAAMDLRLTVENM